MLLFGPHLRRHRLWIGIFIGGTALAVLWYMVAAAGASRLPGGSSPVGFTLGVAAGLIILFEMLLWPRKKFRHGRIGPLKFGPVPYTHYDYPLSAVRHAGNLLAGVREAVGEDVDILLDFHGRPSSMTAAIAYIDAVAPVRPMFVEEPVQPGDPEAMRMIAQKVTVPIATGERLLTHKEFEDLCNLKAVAYVQPDLCHCGGFTIGKHIAATAAANHAGVCPHNPMGPIAGAVGLHFGVAVPNFVILEEASGSVPWFHEVVSQSPIQRVDGFWQIPTTPGLGVEIDEAVAARHPFQQEVVAGLEAFVARDGSIANW